ncbi:MAG: hypothetical protein AMS27_13580 [Bacteroides sp. SM23_62_1]|nr:MAG: hypothetical protein AMS27_13580 [Bacteroides sp. SM23_62_1]
MRIKELLKEELNKELPGIEAQYRMAPGLRRRIRPSGFKQRAAVLILFYPYRGVLSTIFIRRTKYRGVHSGQISLPGGKVESFENDPAHTALRETHEEIGINPLEIEILGRLTELQIPISKIIVSPFVGFMNERPLFQPDRQEVERIIETPLNEFLKQETRQERIKIFFISKALIPYYNINGHHIWGATAMIISEFVEILKRIGDPL